MGVYFKRRLFIERDTNACRREVRRDTSGCTSEVALSSVVTDLAY
jgi:hypothetical protein